MKAWAGHYFNKTKSSQNYCWLPFDAPFYLLNNILIFSSFTDFNQLFRNELMKIKGNKIVYRKNLLKSVQNFPLSRPHKKVNMKNRTTWKKFILKNFWKKHLRTLNFFHEHNVLLVLDHSNCFPSLFAQNLKTSSNQN